MLKRLDKIRFRGQRRDEFLDLYESPSTSDTECSEDAVIRPRVAVKDQEELRDDGETPGDVQVQDRPAPRQDQGLLVLIPLRSVCVSKAGPGSFSAALQDDPKPDLNEVKGLLEVALLEKHFLREYDDVVTTATFDPVGSRS